MSSYHIISEESDFDFLPSCNLGEGVLMVRRLFIESLKGLARMINGLADSLEENEDIRVKSETKKMYQTLEENVLFVKQVARIANFLVFGLDNTQSSNKWVVGFQK